MITTTKKKSSGFVFDSQIEQQNMDDFHKFLGVARLSDGSRFKDCGCSSQQVYFKVKKFVLPMGFDSSLL